ncbi:SH3 domain-containing protein, partial [Tenacibaculum sp. L6]|uniref:SH3 domain-containing protein n=1 Tax=Tenacibaculum sp. L6 TaxID=2992764 RepID=UPI00237AE4D7
LVLSVFTEEFPTYQLIKLEDSGDVLFLGDFTMSIDNFEKIYGEKEVSYFITTDKKGEILLHSKGSKGKLLGRYDEKVNNNPIETLEKTTPKVDTYLNIRSSKDLSTSEVVGMIPKGKEFFILNTFDKWSLVYFEGVYGYVNNEFVR